MFVYIGELCSYLVNQPEVAANRQLAIEQGVQFAQGVTNRRGGIGCAKPIHPGVLLQREFGRALFR